jgi:predicted DNA-binding protein (MmcQ/YjbR family)
MNTEWVRGVCRKLPHTTEEVLWGGDLVFKIGGKMYAVTPLEPGPLCLSFKGTPEEFAELTERPGIIPAPYCARYHWVALESEDALPAAELKRLIADSYEMVLAKLPKGKQAELRGKMGQSGGTETQRKAGKSKVKTGGH